MIRPSRDAFQAVLDKQETAGMFMENWVD